jgi:hypothetical protein
MRLDQTQVHNQLDQPIKSLLGVPVPKQVFHALQPLGDIRAGLWPLFFQCFDLLLPTLSAISS